MVVQRTMSLLLSIKFNLRFKVQEREHCGDARPRSDELRSYALCVYETVEFPVDTSDLANCLSVCSGLRLI